MVVMGSALLVRGPRAPADFLVWLGGVILPGLVYVYIGARPDRARATTTRILFAGSAVLAVGGLLAGVGDIDWRLLTGPTMASAAALLFLGAMTLLIGLRVVPSEGKERRALMGVVGVVVALGVVQFVRSAFVRG